ncbi:MAG: cupin domain-containing protein [Anaerolineae bacterium]|nr:cupin domain-containing protein [Anaerolineae bacterium]
MSSIIRFQDHVGAKAEKFYKTTLFQGDHMLVGLNCLEPGQSQALHDHADQDKVYVVMEGSGHFTIGDAVQEAGEGSIIWAQAGVPHGVENTGSIRLTVLVCMAPPPH